MHGNYNGRYQGRDLSGLWLVYVLQTRGLFNLKQSYCSVAVCETLPMEDPKLKMCIYSWNICFRTRCIHAIFWCMVACIGWRRLSLKIVAKQPCWFCWSLAGIVWSLALYRLESVIVTMFRYRCLCERWKLVACFSVQLRRYSQSFCFVGKQRSAV